MMSDAGKTVKKTKRAAKKKLGDAERGQMSCYPSILRAEMITMRDGFNYFAIG